MNKAITLSFVIAVFIGLSLAADLAKSNRSYSTLKTSGDHLLESADNLSQKAKLFKTQSISQEELQSALTSTRLAYKALEFAFEFLYPSYVEEHINGAPLFHAERHDTRPNVKTTRRFTGIR